ncbi:hypothetical protein H9P43_007478 [Blastocladiella emersonii ATCC 22665]|nr:hypothetical protein H9P43_007478 [Blastocladiella emersonii ATCC 22665]
MAMVIDPSSLTLSQIRNLKRRLVDVGMAHDLEISSLAKSFVYFEKLVLKRTAVKANRRLVGCICLLLATKVNEPKGFKFGPLLESLSKTLGVAVKDIREHEFNVFAQLEFNLYLPLHEFIPHFERIFMAMDFNSLQEYLGDSQFFLARDRDDERDHGGHGHGHGGHELDHYDDHDHDGHGHHAHLELQVQQQQQQQSGMAASSDGS